MLHGGLFNAEPKNKKYQSFKNEHGTFYIGKAESDFCWPGVVWGVDGKKIILKKKQTKNLLKQI